MKRNLTFVLIVLLGSFVLCAGAAFAAPGASYSAVADFSTASNPNGVWTYGVHPESVPDTGVTPMAHSGAFWFGPQLQGYWQNNNIYSPAIAKDQTYADINFANLWLLKYYQLYMVSLPGGDTSVLQFTTPDDGWYRVEATATRIDTVTVDPATSDYAEFTASTHIRYGDIHSADDWSRLFIDPVYGDSGSYAKDVYLAAGSTVYFVEKAEGSYWSSQHLGVQMTVTGIDAPVPEPGSLLALFAGLSGFVGFAARRRK